MTDDEIMHVVSYSTVGSNAIAPTEWCAFARALLAASTSANVAREPDVFEWLETELSAISCRYHGDPSYDHDAYWMRDRALKLIAEARKIFAFASVAQGTEAVEAKEIRQYVLSVLPSVYYMDPPDGGSVSVLEQLRRMADDAAKYRASTAQTALTDEQIADIRRAAVLIRENSYPFPDKPHSNWALADRIDKIISGDKS